MNRLLTTFTGGLISLMIASCSGEMVDYSNNVINTPDQSENSGNQESPAIPEVTPPSAASAPLSSIASENIGNFNDFSLKFYLANSEKTRDNVCVSPFSVGSVLGMIANGDDGEARDEILKVLGFEESRLGMDALNTYYQTLLSNLPNMDKDITCNITNTLWLDPFKYVIRKPFMQTLSDHYYAYLIGIDPNGERGKDAINGFVSRYTNGLIENFLQKPLEDIELAFLNTFYFKAMWSEGFDENLTTEGTFCDINYHEQKTDFMIMESILEYAHTEDGTKAVRLNYGKSKQLSMTFVLPTSDINHQCLDEIMTAENLKQIDRNMSEEQIIVSIPKFEVESNNPKTLEILKDMGLNKCCKYGVEGPFKLITEKSSFFLKDFIHATKLKVDESGSEGAAASLGGMANECVANQIVFNRPFIFYIRENTTGAILFIGSVKTFQ
ncbi:MAG: hypothetical protein K2K93_08350 [Muribaculaceae bacterium]|nr:hypothetical protein [Muribaculaceae bacterium]